MGRQLTLTAREREVLQLQAEGLNAPDTGVELGIGLQSVKTYRKNVLAKLGARRMEQAVMIGLREGIIE